MANDSTTTLNPGIGGDVMDESLVTQASSGLAAKRQRIVIGGDASGGALVEPVAADPGANPYALPSLGVALVDDSPPTGYVQSQLRPISLTTDGRVRVAVVAAQTDVDFFGDDVPCFTGSPTFSIGDNPWGT